ncbi:MAG: hypothetical protein VX026_14200, partial [Myxococcota bacterium]|nr:hypothetical protein [Myxococcota bacterium]
RDAITPPPATTPNTSCHSRRGARQHPHRCYFAICHMARSHPTGAALFLLMLSSLLLPLLLLLLLLLLSL